MTRSDPAVFASGEPERTPAITVVPDAARLAVAVLLAALVVTGLLGGPGSVLGILALAAGAQAVGGLLRWATTRFQLTPTGIRVRTGVLEQSRRLVPYERLQQVDLSATAIERLLGIMTVRVGTAGVAADSEVRVRSLRRTDAEVLRAHLLARRERAVGGEPIVPEVAERPPLLVLGLGRLALAGATGGSTMLAAGAVLAGVGWTIQNALDADLVDESDLVDRALQAQLVVAVIAVVFVMLLPVMGAAYAILRYGGYRLDAGEGRVTATYGALSRRTVTIPLHRVQLVGVADNPLRRRLGLVAVTVRSATGAASDDADRDSSLEVPILDRGDVAGLLAHLGPYAAVPLTPRPAAAKGRAVRRRVLAAGAVALVLGALAVVGEGALAGARAAAVTAFVGVVLVAAAAVGIGLPWGRAAHRRAGHAVDDHQVVLASGALAHRRWHVPRSRVQSGRTAASAFQRRAGLATLGLDVAGTTGPHLGDMDAAAAASVVWSVSLPGRAAT